MAHAGSVREDGGYMPHLDALRALAIAFVLIEHFGGEQVRSNVPIGAGTIGVNLFFVLSGYLITGLLLNALHVNRGSGSARRKFRDFYARRLLRLAPIFYVTIAVLALLGIEGVREEWLWHASYLSNVLVAHGGTFTPFWSLAVEEQFYLVWPLILWLTPRNRLWHMALAVVIAGLVYKVLCASLGLPQKATSVLLFGNLELLGMGALLATICFRGRTNDFSWYRGRRVVAGFAVLALGSLSLALASWWMTGGRGVARYLTVDLLTAIFYAWIVLHGARGFSGWLGAICSLSIVRYVGKISYGIYVTHNFLPDIVRMPAIERLTGELSRLELGLVVLPLTFAVPALSWRYLEQPIRRLKHHFEGGWVRAAESVTSEPPSDRVPAVDGIHPHWELPTSRN